MFLFTERDVNNLAFRRFVAACKHCNATVFTPKLPQRDHDLDAGRAAEALNDLGWRHIRNEVCCPQCAARLGVK